MKKVLCVIGLGLISYSVFAAQRVSEVLPSGKILICKELGKSTYPHSKTESVTGNSAMILPAIGTKVSLSESHSSTSTAIISTKVTLTEIGTATVVEANLEGEDRVKTIPSKSKNGRSAKTTVKITSDEAARIASNCVVAKPDSDLKVSNKNFVSW